MSAGVSPCIYTLADTLLLVIRRAHALHCTDGYSDKNKPKDGTRSGTGAWCDNLHFVGYDHMPPFLPPAKRHTYHERDDICEVKQNTGCGRGGPGATKERQRHFGSLPSGPTLSGPGVASLRTECAAERPPHHLFPPQHVAQWTPTALACARGATRPPQQQQEQQPFGEQQQQQQQRPQPPPARRLEKKGRPASARWGEKT